MKLCFFTRFPHSDEYIDARSGYLIEALMYSIKGRPGQQFLARRKFRLLI